MTAGGRELIIIDDDSSMGQAIERLLAAAGLQARTFSCAETFLASGVVATVLILDIQLPGMSGLDLQRQLLAAGDAPPVIFITAQDQPNTRNQALHLGAAAYFTKPFDGSDLLQAVRQHLPAAPFPLP